MALAVSHSTIRANNKLGIDISEAFDLLDFIALAQLLLLLLLDEELREGLFQLPKRLNLLRDVLA